MAACAAILFWGPATAGTVARTILDDGSTLALFNPSAATDATGRIHVVMQGTDATAPSSGSEDLYYALYNSSGGVLIAPSQINAAATTGRHGRPRVALTSTGQAVITWAGGNLALTFAVVDPSLDTTLDGGALDPAALIGGPTVVGTSTSRGHHAMVIDGNDIAHVVYHRNDPLFYMAFDPSDGSVVNAETQIANGETVQDPGVGVDSAGNIHIATSDSTVHTDRPAVYMMLDNNGAILIAPTKLYDATILSPHAAHYSLVVESDSRVHIFYGDKRNTLDATNWCNTGCSQGGNMIYTVIDPTLDDQSGDAATIATIRVGSEVDMGRLWYARAFPSGSAFHMISSAKSGGALMHTSIARGGTTPSAPGRVEASLEQPGWARPYVTQAGNNLIWSEGIFSPTLVGGTLQLVMASVSSVAAAAAPTVVINEDDDGWFGCTLGSGKGPVDPLLPILAALAGLYLVRRRILPAGL